MDAFAADPVLADPGPSETAPSVSDPQSDALLEYRRMPDNTLPRSARDLRRITTPSGRTFFMAAADNEQAASRERPLGVSVGLGRPLAEVIRHDALVPARPSAQKRQRVWAAIRDMDPPSDNTTRVRVFVNCGELSPGTPVTDPTYVTSLSFFASGHMDHAAHHGHSGRGAMAQASMGDCALVDLGPALARMSRTQPLRGDRIVVQLVPVSAGGSAAASTVRPRRVEIAII